jgi:hypothetical protein
MSVVDEVVMTCVVVITWVVVVTTNVVVELGLGVVVVVVVVVGEGAAPGIHCEYQGLLKTQPDPDTQVVGPDQFIPPH